MNLESVPLDNAIRVGSIDFEPEGIEKAEKLTLEVALTGTPYVNSWDILGLPGSRWNQCRMKVKITEHLDSETLEALEMGKSVLLADPWPCK